jgi:hypothetical protein
VVLLLAAAGCGGGGKQAAGQIVRGTGYRFEAPAGWTIVRSGEEVQAAEGGKSLGLVAVTRFPLIHRATGKLTPKVTKELDAVADGVADQQNGRVTTEKTVDVAGQQARRYDVAYAARGKALIERLTFVLRGKTEYLLLCRFESNGDTGPCDRLVKSFTLT